MRGKFPRQVFLALAILGCAAAYPLMRYGTREMVVAAVAGAALATINVLLGYAAIEYSVGKSATVFIKFVLGGMGIRLAAMTGSILVLLNVFAFHVIALVSSLGICYIVFLAMEILYLQERMSTKQQEHNE